LPHALQGVLRGEAALPRSLVSRVLAEFRRRQQHGRRAGEAGFRDLTSREWEVLELLGEGYTTAEIAEKLFVSSATVRTHVASTLRKLSAPDREAAVALLKQLDGQRS
jgi:DNA-binding NarL/FixJ family response regulator